MAASMMSKSVLRFIDIGANLTDPMFRGIYNGKNKHTDDFSSMLERSTQQGIEKIIVTAGHLTEARQSLDLIKNHPNLYTTIGCHPTRCQEFDKAGDPDQYLADLITLAQENRDKIVAVGECGLDFDRLHFCPKDTQLKYFERQMDIAEATKLPMFLHCRNSSCEFLDIVTRHRERFTGAVVHSFTGSLQDVTNLIEHGLYIGINGCSLKTQENLDVMCAIPKHRLMIETDAPWCEIKPTHAGFKHVSTHFESRKKERWQAGCCVKNRTEPAHIVQVLEVMAACRGDDPSDLADTIYKNTEELFFKHFT